MSAILLVGVSVLLMVLADLRTGAGMRRFERILDLAAPTLTSPRVTDVLVTAPKTSPPRTEP